jgi:tetratricopeptide (TPR) repeat protein
MKGILQRLIGEKRDDVAASLLDDLVMSRDWQTIAARCDAIWHSYDWRHFGLTFVLGQAAENIAANLPWAQRADWFARAVDCYESAAELAGRGEVAGLDLIEEASPDAWPDVASRESRALFAASYRAGLLRVAEFRVRDVARAINHLRVVTSSVKRYHPAWYYLGEAFALAGRFDEAEEAWREGVQRSHYDPTLQSLLNNLPVDRVHYFQKRSDWTTVLAEIARLPDGAMPNAERLTIEGDARQALGDGAGARECWERALAADSSAVGVRQRLRRRATGRVL